MFKLAFYIIFLIYFVNCESANFLGTTRVSWVNTGLKSEFYVTSTLSGLDLNDAWLAVGFNNKNIMVIIKNFLRNLLIFFKEYF